MYPKTFFEQFWESEQKNELFVCMPFHDSYNDRFKIFNEAAIEVGFDKAVRVKEDPLPNEIKTKILDGIANSKFILIDLSDDPKSPCEHSRHINGNVLYEAGIAHAMREPEAILMIRDKEVDKVDFDVRGMTINIAPQNHINKEWLVSLLKSAIDSYEWYKSKRVKSVAESIDDIGLNFMISIGKRPEGANHFNSNKLGIIEKSSIHRLLDLGIIWFATGGSKSPGEYAYHWTSFGYEVMKYLGIHRLSSMEEFERQDPQGYKEFRTAEERYFELKKEEEKSEKV